MSRLVTVTGAPAWMRDVCRRRNAGILALAELLRPWVVNYATSPEEAEAVFWLFANDVRLIVWGNTGGDGRVHRSTGRKASATLGAPAAQDPTTSARLRGRLRA